MKKSTANTISSVVIVVFLVAVVLVAYFILRNLLMIFFGIDPTGDLGFFWDAMRTLRG